MTSHMLADRYELGSLLGTGGMATVYEANDQRLSRPVAVKLLRPETMAEPTARKRFLAEARAAASFNHPHAVAVYDVGSSANEPFIVMELVRGGTLEDVLAGGKRIPEAQVIAVGSQVLGALAAAHRRELVHRDVKPANILLPDGVMPHTPTEAPGVKLADFGIAKATREAAARLTATGQVLGTPKYLSPEQVEGKAATPQSDLYATGVVLYEMLAGRPPFESDSALAVMLAHREQEAIRLDKLRRDIDAGLAELVHQALAKDPADRPVSAREMRQALLERSGKTMAFAAFTSAAPQTTQPATSAQEPTTAPEPEEPAFGTEGRPPAPGPTPTISSGRIAFWIGLLALLGIGVLLLVQALGELTSGRGQPEEAQQQEQPQQEEPPPDDGEEPADDDDEPAAGGASPAEPEEESPQGLLPTEVPTNGGILEQLFRTPASEAGERADDVRDRVAKLLLQDDEEKRLRDFTKLGEEVERWVEDGELERQFADLVMRSVARLVGTDG